MAFERRAKMRITDRISNLPEYLILHIMSFLKTRDAVQTCILSKRWRNLWTRLPCLDFDSDEFNHDEEKFERFVSSVLLRRKTSHLDTFRLQWYHGHNDEEFVRRNVDISRTWVRHALECKPRVLSIEVCGYCTTDLPHSAFTCVSLEEMELFLSHLSEAIRPKSVNLPCLKRLSLFNVTINDDFLKGLIAGCPVLEELNLEHCSLVGDVGLHSDILKYLTVKHCTSQNKFCVSIPSLLSLKLRLSWGKFTVSLTNACSLVGASIIDHLPGKDNLNNKFKLLNGLSNATNLYFYGRKVKAILAKELRKSPKFLNLKNLTLGPWPMNKDFGLVARFLRHCPNLENLTLYHYEPKKKTGAAGAGANTDDLSFRCEKLETIEIKFSEGKSKGVHKLVKMLLKHISNSDKININLSGWST